MFVQRVKKKKKSVREVALCSCKRCQRSSRRFPCHWLCSEPAAAGLGPVPCREGDIARGVISYVMDVVVMTRSLIITNRKKTSFFFFSFFFSFFWGGSKDQLTLTFVLSSNVSPITPFFQKKKKKRQKG